MPQKSWKSRRKDDIVIGNVVNNLNWIRPVIREKTKIKTYKKGNSSVACSQSKFRHFTWHEVWTLLCYGLTPSALDVKTFGYFLWSLNWLILTLTGWKRLLCGSGGSGGRMERREDLSTAMDQLFFFFNSIHVFTKLKKNIGLASLPKGNTGSAPIWCR